MAVLRYSFFIGRDLNYAKRILDNATNCDRKETNLHHRLTIQAVEFIMSQDFEEF
jgi:hypothetical protein